MLAENNNNYPLRRISAGKTELPIDKKTQWLNRALNYCYNHLDDFYLQGEALFLADSIPHYLETLKEKLSMQQSIPSLPITPIFCSEEELAEIIEGKKTWAEIDLRQKKAPVCLWVDKAAQDRMGEIRETDVAFIETSLAMDGTINRLIALKWKSIPTFCPQLAQAILLCLEETEEEGGRLHLAVVSPIVAQPIAQAPVELWALALKIERVQVAIDLFKSERFSDMPLIVEAKKEHKEEALHYFEELKCDLERGEDVSLPEWCHATRQPHFSPIFKSKHLEARNAIKGWGVYFSNADEWGYRGGRREGCTFVFGGDILERIDYSAGEYFGAEGRASEGNLYPATWVRFHHQEDTRDSHATFKVPLDKACFIATDLPNLVEPLLKANRLAIRILPRGTADCIRNAMHYADNKLKDRLTMPHWWKASLRYRDYPLPKNLPKEAAS